MKPEPIAEHPVAEAWRRFAAGDLDGAIASARRSVDDGSSSAEQALAALGFFLLQAGSVDEAAAVLLPARDRFPGHAPLHWYIGYLHQRQGDAIHAAEALERACELDETLDEAAYALAWVLHDLGRMREAARWARRALARSATPERTLQVGWLNQQLGMFASAAHAYREAIDAFGAASPEQPRLHLHLSQCLRHLDQDDEADTLLWDALDRWPLDAELMTEGGWRLRSGGDVHGALRLVRELVRHHPERASAWHLLGVLEQDAGSLEAADEAFAQAQERDLSLTDALLRRALIRRKWKQFAGAQWLLELVLRQSPDDESAKDLLVQVLLDLDQTEAARRLLLECLRERPHVSDLWRLLAIVRSRRGRPAFARRALRRALAEDAGNVEALRMRGWWALDQDDSEDALDAVRQLLARRPDDSAAQVQAAFVLAHAGHLGWAQMWAERAVAQAPDVAEAWRALAQVRLAQGRLVEAEEAVREALRLAPDHPDGLRQWGWMLMSLARPGQAQLAFLRAIEGRPGDPVARLELAEAQRRAGHFAAASKGVDALLQERRAWRPALLAKARLMVEGGLEGAAQACAQLLRANVRASDAVRLTLRLSALGDAAAARSLQMVPIEDLRDTARTAIGESVHLHGQAFFSRLVRLAAGHVDEDGWISTAALYAASLSSRSDAPALARQARDWYRGLKVRSGLAKQAYAGRHGVADPRPRIAYVATQLHQSLLRRVLAAHTSGDALVYLYTNHRYDALPAHVHLQPLVIQNLAESCAANRIDVVIDAGGLHPFEGQFELLQAYARRVAPVQVGWLGCWGSAGGLFDALLADRFAVPGHQEAAYDEPVFHLEGGQWCWDPPVAAPEPGPPPIVQRGTVTYGVTARSVRLDAACLDAYAGVLAATADSEIRFIGQVAEDWPLRRDILARMQAKGVDAGRVFFDPFLPHAAYLEWFKRIDLVLDSFPASGGLSLLDPLWMGVPVVTLAGGWAGARQGASVLSTLGLQSWVAETEAGFCKVAAALGRDFAALSRYRASLRAIIAASPLVDGRRVATQIEAICTRLKEDSAAHAGATDAKARTKAHAQWALDAWLARPRTIELPAAPPGEEPGLSVVIVLFNQAGLSLRTLQALADQRGLRFETIIVDNASGDRTTELLARVRGARVIRNEGNDGFILAARQGAAMAKGRYLAFLNSDAILQEGALAAALQAIEADPSIGALGARVVLTDGGLQEAGNAVFRDGLTLGIGRGEDAFGHAARASRCADYVSGVFLLTPRALWHKLGGFDTAFVPAYYEDTDYSLRVWEAGLRVVYEPSVLLEHLEWGSATGDSATRLMDRNRELFRARHGEWLRKQSRPQALPLDGDRWRSPEDRLKRLPRVLFLDNEVPHMYKGGGLPRARLMLQALHGWPVTFYPLWTIWDNWRDVYAMLPRSVEVALGHGLGGLEAFLERRRGVYDVLLVSRPPNLQALQPLRRRRPELFEGMRLVYDAEALFALREIAMAAVLGRPMGRAKAQSAIDAEMSLAAGASEVLVVSDRDARHFENAGYRTRILSHGIPVRNEAPGIARRKGLLFVGALHPGTPNEDGLLWFIREVMPRLRRLRVPPVLSVVGVCQSQEVAAMAGPDVKILGPQDALEPHYDAARIFVAPARFAGGVPLKVIEAAAGGIPSVASAVLVRQLGWRDGLDIQGARDAGAFAHAIAKLLDDDALWLRQQSAAWEQCRLRYDPEVIGRTLRQVLGGPPEPAP